MARFGTLVVAKSDDVSITPAKCRIKNKDRAMAPKGSGLIACVSEQFLLPPFYINFGLGMCLVMRQYWILKTCVWDDVGSDYRSCRWKILTLVEGATGLRQTGVGLLRGVNLESYTSTELLKCIRMTF